MEWIGSISYGQISNIILALGLLGCVITVAVVAFVAIVENKRK